jgi:hypothetical protein
MPQLSWYCPNLWQALVQGAQSTTEAAMAINRGIWQFWGIVFKPDQTPEIMSPSQACTCVMPLFHGI